ncbi:FtsH protease activity modulator HflK [Pseudomonadota bacterium]
MKNLLSYKSNGNSGGSNKGRGGNTESFISSFRFKSLGLVFILLMILWLTSGFYKVGPDQNAVVLYFGKFHSISTPGLNYHIPMPFGEAIKISVTSINKEEFGFNSTQSVSNPRMFGSNQVNIMTRDFEAESLMLTGDENIADIDFEVQWKIADVKNYLFSLANPKLTVREVTESAMREIIAKRPIDDALAQKKSEIEREVKDLVQNILDSYNSGVEIVLVQLLRVDPPKHVINAFRDVQTAKADKEREINEAKIYQNDILPRARGQAEQVLQEAEGYKQSIIAGAEGKAARFNQVYDEYRKAKTVTRKRMYLETMEEVMIGTEKVIIDEKASETGVVPYIYLDNRNTKK